MISVVIPVYKGSPFLVELCDRLSRTLSSLEPDHEIILVNDASPDGSWEIIRRLAGEKPFVKGINLSHNFGQHYAITAGLTYARGEWVVVMDCDLQDVPEEIVKLYQKAQTGFDTVFAQRVERKDTWWKRMQSKLFYQVFSFLTDTKLDASVANFGIYHKKVITAILSLGDAIRYFPTMARYVGFRQCSIPVIHAARPEGKSSYSLWKLLNLATDNIIGFSNKPLRIFAALGFWMSFSAFLIALVYFICYLCGKFSVAGWISLLLSVWFLGGCLMFGLGIVGIYIGRTFNQTKHRPLFIVDETLNVKREE